MIHGQARCVPDKRNGAAATIRHVTLSLFAALDVATEKVIGKRFARHLASEFLRFLREIENNVLSDFDIHLVMDYSSTHKAPTIREWLLRHPRRHIHFTA